MKKHFSFPALPSSPFFCFPESVGWYARDPEHDVNRKQGALDFFNLHLVIQGKGFVEINKQTYTLQQGDSFIYFPSQEQHYYSSQEEPWEVLWLHFSGFRVKEFLLEQGFHRTSLWTLRHWKPLAQAFHELLEEVEQHRILHTTLLSTLTYKILIEFMSQAVFLTTDKSTESTERIIRLLPRLQQVACKPFNLNEWAAEAGVSSYYFCKIFRKAVHMTPLDFITLCRMQFAKQWLLEHKETPIKEIAELSGYPSVSYFSKRFYDHEKVTPSEFRRAHWDTF